MSSLGMLFSKRERKGEGIVKKRGRERERGRERDDRKKG
jgi:hypothetical protein